MNYSKYNKSRFNNIISGLLPSFISLFKKSDKNFIVLNSFHNMQFNDNTKAFFLYLKDNTNYKIKYVINDSELRNTLKKEYGDFFLETISFRGKIEALKAKTWIVNSFEMPVGGFFQKMKRNIIHLSHGLPIKNLGLTEKDISFIKKIYYKLLKTNITYTIVPSKELVDFTKRFMGIKNKNILLCGYPRYDVVIKGKKIEKQDGIIRILYAPTWRHFSETKLFPFEDFNIDDFSSFCKKNSIEVYLRVHPRFQDKIPLELFKSSCIKDFSGAIEPDINESLYKFDMLITDYSSIFYDYYLLNRPIFFFDYDHEEYEKNVGFAVPYEKFAVGYRTHSMKMFFDDINDAMKNDKYKTQREAMNNICNGISDNNSKDLLNKLKELNILT